MTERAESESYWQADLSLGEIELEEERYPLRLRLHRAQESYQERRELVPLEFSAGERQYLHATPYLVIPDVQLVIDLDPSPQTIPSNENGAAVPLDRVIGEVAAVEMRKTRAREIGNVQGWCYPAERLIVLWEVLLYDWCRADDPLRDLLLDRIWRRFEELLVETLPDAGRIVTPAWEQEYPREVWQAFLIQQGYSPTSSQAFTKQLTKLTPADSHQPR